MDRDTGAGDLRASDQDRDAQAEVIRTAAAEGRLNLTELDERLEQVYAAKTYAELAAITRDLPGAVEQTAGNSRKFSRKISGELVERQQMQAILSGEKLKGAWMAPRHMSIRVIVGSMLLDFTEASMPHEVVIDAMIVCGELTVIVPDDVAVELEPGTTVLSERSNKTTTPRTPGTPVIKIRGGIYLSAVTIKPPSSFIKWLRRGRS